MSWWEKWTSWTSRLWHLCGSFGRQYWVEWRRYLSLPGRWLVEEEMSAFLFVYCSAPQIKDMDGKNKRLFLPWCAMDSNLSKGKRRGGKGKGEQRREGESEKRWKRMKRKHEKKSRRSRRRGKVKQPGGGRRKTKKNERGERGEPGMGLFPLSPPLPKPLKTHSRRVETLQWSEGHDAIYMDFGNQETLPIACIEAPSPHARVT